MKIIIRHSLAAIHGIPILPGNSLPGRGDPSNTVAFRNLGLVNYEQGDLQKAKEACEEAIWH